MGTTEQFVTIAAVLLGAMSSYVANFLMERSRNRYQLKTRWDDKKLSAYETYIDRMRACIFLAAQLYEQREGMREAEKPEQELLADVAEAGRLRGRAFERVMLLGGDDVVEAAHELNAAALEVDWQAAGKTAGTLQQWRDRNRAVFRAINVFHEAAREDLGVQGSVSGSKHPERDLLLPPLRQERNSSPR
ncbi:hypothetical protein [Streptomyces paromomycinus]|uniref:hypothetical protein n=1 Tax=Streptomyces paromomycinus TaxID=92743 RepID=UPI000F624D24|nr:hypothetical protein [Streptomyces paromomycinus]